MSSPVTAEPRAYPRCARTWATSPTCDLGNQQVGIAARAQRRACDSGCRPAPVPLSSSASTPASVECAEDAAEFRARGDRLHRLHERVLVARAPDRVGPGARAVQVELRIEQRRYAVVPGVAEKRGDSSSSVGEGHAGDSPRRSAQSNGVVEEGTVAGGVGRLAVALRRWRPTRFATRCPDYRARLGRAAEAGYEGLRNSVGHPPCPYAIEPVNPVPGSRHWVPACAGTTGVMSITPLGPRLRGDDGSHVDYAAGSAPARGRREYCGHSFLTSAIIPGQRALAPGTPRVPSGPRACSMMACRTRAKAS